MPRKVGIGPAILRIEGLSTGRDPLAVDEFSGKPLPQPHAKPPKIDNAQVARDAMNRAERERKMQLLNDTLYRKAPQVELIPKGYYIVGRLGDRAMLKRCPPWRRV